MTTELDLGDLWLDANQGSDKNEHAFGYIGTNEETVDDDGDDVTYCGWFFTWPGERAKITSEDERQQVIDSLEADETEDHLPRIPHDLAVEKLTAYLARRFDDFSEEV